jgi:RNA polymerase sigma-70 factor (ECF subfamily)
MRVDSTHTFERVYREESDAIFRFCLVRVSNREQAMDITQETFLRLWQSLSQEKEIINSRAFLFTVAHRLIIDWYRKKKTFSLEKIVFDKKEDEYDLPDESPLSNVEYGAEGRYLVEKIDELSPTYKDPVYLRFVEGLSPGEIGSILGISSNAASVRVNRGLLELRKKTGYDEEDNKKVGPEEDN